MNTRTSSIVGFILTALLFAGCSKEPQPSKVQIQQSLATQLPNFVRISSFSIEAMQNMGTKVEPVWQARFRATVTFGSSTFTPDGNDSEVVFLRAVKKTGDSLELFGKSSSQLYAGNWRTSIDVDGQPFGVTGLPESAFASAKVIIRGSAAETEYLRAKQERILAEQKLAAETAEIARLSQVATKVIGKYQYIAAYGGDIRKIIPIPGTITLTDVGVALSGEQPDGSAKPTNISFFDSLAARVEFYKKYGYSGIPETSLWRANFVSQMDFRIVWNSFWSADYNTALVFDTLKERDRFFVDLTTALQEWATKFARVAGAQVKVDQRCEVNTYMVPWSETNPFYRRE